MYQRLFVLIFLLSLKIFYTGREIFAGSHTGIVYYVDAATGNDSNTGHTPKQAWRTLDKVNNVIFKPGDRLLFKAGAVYNGQLRPKGSGTATQPIIIDKFGEGAKPMLQAEGLYPATIYLYNAEHWQLQNLDVSNAGEQRQAKRYGIHVEVRNFGTAHNITLKNIDVHDVNGSLVKNLGGGAGIVFTNGGNRVRSNFDGLLIQDCTVKRTARNGILINGNWERNRWFPSRNALIKGNLIEEVPGDGIVPIGCDGAVIEYNVMRDSPRMLPEGEAAAGIWPWSCDNTIIQYNEVSDHKAPWDAQGFDADWNCRNTIIQYNYSHDNEGGFLLVCNDGSVRKPASTGNTGTIIRYNVSFNDGLRATGKHAGFSPVFHISGPVKNTRIYNNVVYVTQKAAGIDNAIIKMDTWHGIPDSTIFANNIFYVKGVGSYSLAKSTRHYFHNNLYYGKQLDMPHDDAAIFTDPLFCMSNNLGTPGLKSVECFKLLAGSPALKKGRAMDTATLNDFFGNRIVNLKQPAIGIHEFTD